MLPSCVILVMPWGLDAGLKRHGLLSIYLSTRNPLAFSSNYIKRATSPETLLEKHHHPSTTRNTKAMCIYILMTHTCSHTTAISFPTSEDCFSCPAAPPTTSHVTSRASFQRCSNCLILLGTPALLNAHRERTRSESLQAQRRELRVTAMTNRIGSRIKLQCPDWGEADIDESCF